MRSYAAGRWAVLWKLRVPASLPYVFSALKIAATASVVGAIIGELPSGLQSGLGGAIINFNQYYSLEPQELWATNIVAAAARDRLLPRRRARREAASSAARRSTSHERRARPVVSIEDVTKTFPQGNVTALQDIDLAARAGRVRLADRPVGLRQVDAAARDRRPDRADARAR